MMLAINQANIAPQTRDPAARCRYGRLATPALDVERRPISVHALAASMRLPYETARRSIRRMEAKGVCGSTDAGIIVPATFLLTPAFLGAGQRA